ncbi:MAG: type II toxin-antitoxin system RelE/ParE family toxin [Acidobacteriota bacterium]
MAERYQVVWSDAAAADLEAIGVSIALDSPAAAFDVLTKLEKRAASLKTSPQRGRRIPELEFFAVQAWRELVMRPYRLMYEISGDSVRVLGVFDGRRDLQDVLLERALREG